MENKTVGMARFELATSCAQGRRASQAALHPDQRAVPIYKNRETNARRLGTDYALQTERSEADSRISFSRWTRKRRINCSMAPKTQDGPIGRLASQPVSPIAFVPDINDCVSVHFPQSFGHCPDTDGDLQPYGHRVPERMVRSV
jgi:hypothetical protein